MWFIPTSSSTSVMQNLKTRIKRGKNSPKKGSTEECVDDWQFVNFNPFIFNANSGGAGNRRSLAFGEISASSSSPNNPTDQQTPFNFGSGGREDFYEFPTSTKLNLKRNSHDEALALSLAQQPQNKTKEKDDANLLKNLQRRSLQNVPPSDVLPPYSEGEASCSPPNPNSVNLLSFEEVLSSPSTPPPPRPPLPLPGCGLVVPVPLPPSLKKSNSVISTSSSSGASSLSSPTSSAPVSRSSSRGKDESLSRSTFYVPPALPPKGSRLRTSALSLVASPPETVLRSEGGGGHKKKGKKPPPPPPQNSCHADFMDFDEVDLISASSLLKQSCYQGHLPSIPPPPPPPPPPYPKEGLCQLIRSNNTCSAGSRPVSWDLNLRAGTVTLLDEGLEFKSNSGSEVDGGGKKSKRSSFYHVHLHGRKNKDKMVTATSPPKPALPPPILPTTTISSSGGPPLPLKPRKMQQPPLGHGHTHHHPNHLFSVHQQHNHPTNGGVANLCMNLSTISRLHLFLKVFQIFCEIGEIVQMVYLKLLIRL